MDSEWEKRKCGLQHFFHTEERAPTIFFLFYGRGVAAGARTIFFFFFTEGAFFSYRGKGSDDFFFLRKGRGGQGLGHFFYGRGMTAGRSDDTVSYFLCGSRFEQGRRT